MGSGSDVLLMLIHLVIHYQNDQDMQSINYTLINNIVYTCTCIYYNIVLFHFDVVDFNFFGEDFLLSLIFSSVPF